MKNIETGYPNFTITEEEAYWAGRKPKNVRCHGKYYNKDGFPRGGWHFSKDCVKIAYFYQALELKIEAVLANLGLTDDPHPSFTPAVGPPIPVRKITVFEDGMGDKVIERKYVPIK